MQSLEVQTLEVISINLWLVLISLANLAILYAILKKFLYKPVKATMAARKTLAVFPNRRENRSGMEVTSYCIPMSEMRPETPEKINIPSR